MLHGVCTPYPFQCSRLIRLILFVSRFIRLNVPAFSDWFCSFPALSVSMVLGFLPYLDILFQSPSVSPRVSLTWLHALWQYHYMDQKYSIYVFVNTCPYCFRSSDTQTTCPVKLTKHREQQPENFAKQSFETCMQVWRPRRAQCRVYHSPAKIVKCYVDICSYVHAHHGHHTFM